MEQRTAENTDLIKKEVSRYPAQCLEARTIRPPFYILFVADQNCVTSQQVIGQNGAVVELVCRDVVPCADV